MAFDNAVYNVSSFNYTNYNTFLATVNSELTFGWLGIGILLAFGILLFASFVSATGKPRQAISYTSILLLVPSFLLRGLNLVPDLSVFILIAFASITFFIYILWPD